MFSSRGIEHLYDGTSYLDGTSYFDDLDEMFYCFECKLWSYSKHDHRLDNPNRTGENNGT